MEYLLDLDGQIMDMGDGHWVKIEARPVPPTPGRPAGDMPSLTTSVSWRHGSSNRLRLRPRRKLRTIELWRRQVGDDRADDQFDE